jgi:flagellar assembly protein FliH
MLAKILAESAVSVESIPWRAGRAAVARKPQPPPPAEAPARDTASQEAELKQQMRQAFESGRREGETAARQKLEGEVRELTTQLAQAAADVASSRVEAIHRAETDVLQLSVEIARRILHRELSIDPSALAGLIRAGLEKLASQKVHRVRVHPEHADLARACLGQTSRAENIEVVSDPALPRGGAVFESARGSLDASVETQLREIERGLADQLQERS